MTLNAWSDRFVVLRPGLIVSREALEAVLDLEQRGVRLTAQPDGAILAAPRTALTDADRASVKRWKFHILAILAYEPPALV